MVKLRVINKKKKGVGVDSDNDNFTISNTTKGKPSGLPFVRIKEEVLGKKYGLSLVFIGDRRAKDLNRRYRGKDKPSNVLAFSLEKDSGEIFINLAEIKRRYREFNMSKKTFTAYLFVHGLLHLKGHSHSSKMENEEQKILKKFNLLK